MIPTNVKFSKQNSIINVIDSSMGTGKSNAIISKINLTPNRKFIVIVDSMTEVNRFIHSIVDSYTPYADNNKKTKSIDILNEIKCHRVIITTKKLFENFSTEFISHLSNFTLILDEVTDLVDAFQISSDEIDTLLHQNLIEYNSNNKLIVTNKFTEFEKIAFDKIYNIINSHDIIRISDDNENINYFAVSNIDIFKTVKETWLLTFLFDTSTLKAVFMYFDFDIVTYYIDKNSIIEGEQDLMEFKNYTKNHIKILDNINMNDYDKYTLSNGWLSKQKNNSTKIKKLKNNHHNFYMTYTNKSNYMFTCLKSQIFKVNKSVSVDKCWISHTTRGTNNYQHISHFAYIINKFQNPYINRFCTFNNPAYNQDDFSVSEFLQLIYRFNIRKGEVLTIYIPSKRMRDIITKWLDWDIKFATVKKKLKGKK